MKEEVDRQGASTQIREEYLLTQPAVLANFSNFKEIHNILLRREAGETIQPYCHFTDEAREMLYQQRKKWTSSPMSILSTT